MVNPSGVWKCRALACAVLALGLSSTGCVTVNKGMESVGNTVDKGYNLLTGMYSTGTDIVDQVDRRLGEERVEDKEEKVRVSTKLSIDLEEGGKTDVGMSIGVRLPLPALQRRANAFIEIGGDRTSETDIEDPNVDKGEETGSVGLKYIYALMDQVSTGVSTSVRWEDGLQLKVKPFIRYEDTFGSWRLYANEYVAWDSLDDWTEETSASVDYVLGTAGFFRLYGALFWEKINEDSLFVNNALSFRHAAGKWSAWVYEVGANYPVGELYNDEGDPHGKEYYGYVRWTGRVWRPWFEMKVKPRVTYDLIEEETVYDIGIDMTFLYERYLRAPESGDAVNPAAP